MSGSKNMEMFGTGTTLQSKPEKLETLKILAGVLTPKVSQIHPKIPSLRARAKHDHLTNLVQKAKVEVKADKAKKHSLEEL
jgi:hypothetical protein